MCGCARVPAISASAFTLPCMRQPGGASTDQAFTRGRLSRRRPSSGALSGQAQRVGPLALRDALRRVATSPVAVPSRALSQRSWAFTRSPSLRMLKRASRKPA